MFVRVIVSLKIVIILYVVICFRMVVQTVDSHIAVNVSDGKYLFPSWGIQCVKCAYPVIQHSLRLTKMHHHPKQNIALQNLFSS